jgi:hypothetical protein
MRFIALSIFKHLRLAGLAPALAAAHQRATEATDRNDERNIHVSLSIHESSTSMDPGVIAHGLPAL